MAKIKILQKQKQEGKELDAIRAKTLKKFKTLKEDALRAISKAKAPEEIDAIIKDYNKKIEKSYEQFESDLMKI